MRRVILFGSIWRRTANRIMVFQSTGQKKILRSHCSQVPWTVALSNGNAIRTSKVVDRPDEIPRPMPWQALMPVECQVGRCRPMVIHGRCRRCRRCRCRPWLGQWPWEWCHPWHRYQWDRCRWPWGPNGPWDHKVPGRSGTEWDGAVWLLLQCLDNSSSFGCDRFPKLKRSFLKRWSILKCLKHFETQCFFKVCGNKLNFLKLCCAYLESVFSFKSPEAEKGECAADVQDAANAWLRRRRGRVKKCEIPIEMWLGRIPWIRTMTPTGPGVGEVLWRNPRPATALTGSWGSPGSSRRTTRRPREATDSLRLGSPHSRHLKTLRQWPRTARQLACGTAGLKT